jgi:hypothetical protein
MFDIDAIYLKLKFKAKAVAINVPAEFKILFKQYGFAFKFSTIKENTNVIVFVNSNSELVEFLDTQFKRISYDGVFWIVFTKQSSKIKTDINRDIIMQAVQPCGLDTVAAISINETWSALRVRPKDCVGK